MPKSETIAALNRLVQIHNRSLAMYLHSARPWTRPGDELASETLKMIAADHQRTVDRLGRVVLDFGGRVDMGEFPMEFTDLHDLSMSFLLKELVRYQKRDIRRIQQCIDDLRLAPLARAVGEESLGAAKGHLDTLEELIAGRRTVNGVAPHIAPATTGGHS